VSNIKKALLIQAIPSHDSKDSSEQTHNGIDVFRDGDVTAGFDPNLPS
jgi:hypothetical protein